MKILMVCLGNICRSPLAEGILKHKVAAQGLNWSIDSAGTGSWHVGESPDKRSVQKAKEYGIDISKQRARQFYSGDFSKFDIIYTMDVSNYNNVCKAARTEADKAKVKMILNELYPNQNRVVPDPYWNNDGFEEVYQLLNAACNKIIEKYSSN